MQLPDVDISDAQHIVAALQLAAANTSDIDERKSLYSLIAAFGVSIADAVGREAPPNG